MEREPKAKREARGDAEELTETRRSPRQQATRWREKAKPTGRRRVPSREVGEVRSRSRMEVQGSRRDGRAGSQFSAWERDHPERPIGRGSWL